MKIQYIPDINLPGGNPIPNSKLEQNKFTEDRNEEEPFAVVDVLFLRLFPDNYCGVLPFLKNVLALSGAKPCHMNHS
jgi:hypothetical protein